MSSLRFGVAAIACAVLAATLPARQGDKIRFEPKLEKDKPFYQKMSTDVTQFIKVQGQELTQKQTSTFYYKWTPEKLEGDKWTIKQQVEGLKMSIDISGNPITFDSTAPDAAPGAAGNPGLMDFFKNLVGAQFTVTLNAKTFQVEKVDGKDEFLKKLGAGNAQMDALLRKIMTDDSLKQMADPTFGMVPTDPKGVNDTWERKATLSLGPIGSYDVTYKFKYVGKEKVKEGDKDKEFDKLEVSTVLEYKPPMGDTTEGLLFRIKGGSLKQPTDNPPVGKILYDRATGQVHKAEIPIKLKGKLTVAIGGTDTDVELNQDQTTTIETSGSTLLPAPKK